MRKMSKCSIILDHFSYLIWMNEKYTGSLLRLAIGDALGAPLYYNQFDKANSIII